MGEYAMTFRARWWIHSYRDTRHVYDRVYTTLLSSFKEAGIKMPTDSYDINIMNMPGDKNDKSQQNKARVRASQGKENSNF
jgi:small-conductance mechanosensitive channel